MKRIASVMDKYDLTIGLLGAPINNKNLGCQALTYSLVNQLCEASKSLGIKCHYIVFEYLSEKSNLQTFCNNISIDSSLFEHFHLTAFGESRSYLKNFSNNLNVIKKLKECDFVIDITEGDSFTDIYGNRRFWSLTRQKYIIEKLGIPLVLGPQTYGPFNNSRTRKYASKVIKKAAYIISRDNPSADLVEKLSGRKVYVTTDVAFQLPYKSVVREQNDKIKIGLNISGLLVRDQVEQNDKMFALKTDYDLYIDTLLADICKQQDKYEVYLIPHVFEDCQAIKSYHKKYPETIMLEMFNNPIEAKNLISQMDYFIGARMHATIAAFTSGVLTIPTAYSRKFNGLFSLVEYPLIVDLQNLDTAKAVSLTFEYLNLKDKVKQLSESSLKKCKAYSEKTEKIFKDILHYYL